jgi:hypothetical protein
MATKTIEPYSKKRGRPRKETLANWRVLRYGADFDRNSARMVSLTCLGCGHDADLPVVGLAIAQIGQGLVFDIGPRDTPKEIQCPRCRKILEAA